MNTSKAKLHRNDIRIRDPYIFTDKKNGCYYMYGTTALVEGSLCAKDSFTVYKSYDLEYFEEPRVIFCGSECGFWGTNDYWAPEMHEYNGKYYLFASMIAKDRNRATQIFVCDTPDGNFVPVSDEAITPKEWMCLDGTLFVEKGIPYMVFSHEWTQIKNGEIWAMPFKEDLSAPAGKPFMLFRASDNPYVTELEKGTGNYVTDGPFLYYEDSKLKMLWSSFAEGRYVVLEAEADTLAGPWTHKNSRFEFDGGHAMVFETLENKKMISLHSPNTANDERAHFYEF